MKIFFGFFLITFTHLANADRIKHYNDIFPKVQGIEVEKLQGAILESNIEFHRFLEAFFRDFTAHPKTKILMLNPLSPCSTDFCFELKLDYYYWANEREKNVQLTSTMKIGLEHLQAMIQIQNHIPKTVKALVAVTPESWIDDFPIMQSAQLELLEHNQKVDVIGEVHSLNKVKEEVLREFLNDFITSFIYHLKENVKSP